MSTKYIHLLLQFTTATVVATSKYGEREKK
uniref:Uncharacterized protein n=1 Tax=Rhodnius prolixus TaxID=13249 RepID=T1HL92_RHOPR